MGRIMVVCGETSGDIHAARVVKEIKKKNSNIEFTAMGSEALKREGAEILIDPLDVSSIGFLESFKNLKEHLAHIRLLKKHMRENRPDILFLVDYSGFNMMMARVAKKLGIPVVDYFPPTAWIWGKWRAKWMARYDAVIAATLPMESEIYKRAGAEVEFVGHPLLDIVGTEKSVDEICDEFQISKNHKIIALMPGSRKSEIDRLAPVIFEVAEKLQKDNSNYQFILPLAPGINKDYVADIASDYNLILKIVRDSSYEIMKIADFVITASGTATLESLIMETPMLVLYETGWSTYKIGKKIMKTDYIAMPNIIAGTEVVPEFVQDEIDVKNIYDEAKFFIKNDYLLSDKKKKLKIIKDKLGEKGAVKKTAELVLEVGGLN
ncbi:MAG: lipid-A-disaccharide synthase [Bacillota bacterium]